MSERRTEGGELRVDGRSGTASTLNPQPSTISPLPLSPNQRAWRRFKRNRPAMIGVWFLALVLVFVLIYPLLSPYRAEQLSDDQFQPPGARHWLGTDVHGRDLLVRLCYGAQIS